LTLCSPWSRHANPSPAASRVVLETRMRERPLVALSIRLAQFTVSPMAV
jgi:hypothetical protein